MSEAKHTKGPWVVGTLDPLTFKADRRSHKIPIGYVYGPSGDSGFRKQAEADCRLISAAPDLLEATTDLLRILRGNAAQIEPDELPGHQCEAMERAREAIAKATGAAPC